MELSLPGTVNEVLPIEEASQLGYARRVAQRLAESVGLDETAAGRVALVTMELGTNLLKHADAGVLYLRAVPGRDCQGVEVLAVDRGPGFDLGICQVDGYSTRGTQGSGIGALQRQADVFDAYSEGRGSVVMARVYPRGGARDLPLGVMHQALEGETACGDGWHLVADGARLSVVLIDGLGHGEDAEHAARAGTRAFAQAPFDSPSMLFSEMNQAMTSTRGGAVALAQFEAGQGRLTFAGIGNIGVTLLGPGKARGLVSLPGIVGAQFRKVQSFDYPDIAGQLLVLFSDGLRSRWSLDDYPGLRFRHPAVIAAVLHRDFRRGRDDVTVMAIALEGLSD